MRTPIRLTAPFSAALAGTLFFSAVHSASAATDTWSSTPAGVNWNSTDWTGGNAPPLANDSLVFGSSTQTILNNNFGALMPFDGLTFNGGSAFTLNGNSVLITGNMAGSHIGVANSSGLVQTLGTLPLTLDLGYYTFASSSGTLALNGGMTLNTGGVAYFDINNTSTSGLTTDVTTGLITGLEGAGLMYGTTSAPSTGLGPIGLATLSGGTITALTSFTTVASGAISSGQNIKLTTTGASVTDTAANGTTVNTITVAQVGTVAGNNTTTLNIAANGTLNFANRGGVYVLNSGAGTKACLTLGPTNGNITAGSGSTPASIVVAVNGDNPGNQATISAIIKDNTVSGPVSVVVSGSGAVAINSAFSTYSGGLYVNQGQAQMNVTSVGTGPIYVASGATAFLNGAGTYTNNIFISPGFGTPVESGTNANPGAIFLSGNGAAGFIGTLNLMGAPVPDASIGNVAGDRLTGGNVAGNTYTFAGQITGTGTLDFNTSIRAANFILTNTSVVNTNNWQGGMFIEASTAFPSSARNAIVKLGANNQIPSGPNAGDVSLRSADNTVFNSVVRLDLNGFNATINGLNAVVPPNNFPVSVTDLGSTSCTLTLGGGNASGNYAGIMNDGGASKALNLVKIGSGNQTLNGADTCFGSMTVNAGTLTFGGSETVANRPTFNVASAGTLDVSIFGGFTFGANQTLNAIGIVNGATVISSNAVINPFLGAIGTLTDNGGMTLNGGCTYVWNINNATGMGSDPGFSLINLTGGGQCTLNASTTSPIKIKITSLNGSDVAGNATFNTAMNQTFPILTSTTSVANFNALDFVIDTSAFSNLPGGASAFTVANTTALDLSGNNLYLVYTAAPAISTGLVNQTNNAGTTATFTVIANGATPPITFNWTQNGNPLISGGSSASSGAVTITTNSHTSVLTIANVQDADAVGGISVSVTDGVNSGTSTATLTVVDPPVTQPTVAQSGTIANSTVGPANAGGRTYLAGTQSDGSLPLSYQWYLGATPILGATNATLPINIAANTAGSYTLVVSNQAGSVTSSPIVINQVLSIPGQIIFEPFGSYAPEVFPISGTATWQNVTNLFNQLTGEPSFWILDGTSDTMTVETNGLNNGSENQFGGEYPWPGLAGDATNEMYWNSAGPNNHLRITTNGATLFTNGGPYTNIFFSFVWSAVSLGTNNGIQDVVAGFCTSNGTTAFNYELVSQITSAGAGQYALGISKGNGANGRTVNGTTASPMPNVQLGPTLQSQVDYFVVGCYSVASGGTNAMDDTVSLWINPASSTFFASAPPTPSVGPTSFGVSNSIIQDFVLRSANLPASHRITDLRIGTTWASVTPPLGPTLSVVYNSPNAIITWPTNWAGYVLEQSPAVLPAVWTTNSLPPYAVTGTNFAVTNNASGTAQFYRLQHP